MNGKNIKARYIVVPCPTKKELYMLEEMANQFGVITAEAHRRVVLV
jgi:hypothetical protein